MSRTSRGFTFVEILVALSVFGALTAIAVPRYRNFKERAYVASMKSELGNLRVAEEAYWAEHLRYAADTTALDWNGSGLVKLEIMSDDLVAGYTATATHDNYPGTQCTTYVGRAMNGTPSGDIRCGSTSTVGTGVTN